MATRELGFDDYMKIARRRLRVILVPALIGAALGFVVSLVLTPEYTSESLILIERPTVPESLVPAVTPDDLFIRLATMEERIESRSQLQPLIERYDLYGSERRGSMEEAVDEMRKAIKVKETAFEDTNVKSNQKEPIPGFSVDFTADNPRLAQQVCTELTSMFMAENLQQHEQDAKGTTEFITSQLDDAKRQLDAQDAAMAAFKAKNLGALPNDSQANLQVLASLNTQLVAVTDQINRAQQNRAYEQSLLSEQESEWKASAASPEDANNLAVMKDQLAKMKDTLAIDRGRYTDDYPDVVKLKRDIAELQKQIDAQSAGSSPSGSSSSPAPAGSASSVASGATGPAASKSGPAVTAEGAAPGAGVPATGAPGSGSQIVPASIQQLRATLKQDDIFINQKTKEQEKLQQQVKGYEGRLQVSPEVEEEYNKLSLGHDAALKFYNTLLANRDASQMSVNLESQGQGETFRELDAPDLPQHPSFPVWWQFALGGLGAGLVIGMIVAAVFELGDKSLRDEKDVEFYLGLPILALVPSIGVEHGSGNNGRGRFWRRRKQRALPAGGAAAAKVSA